MTSATVGTGGRGGNAEMSLGLVLWIAASILFVSLRVGYAVGAPVGGLEWMHLSGAWQASIGEPDTRFVPTLFQSLSALSLRISDSESPARWVALLASSTTPLALFLLRSRLGDPGALLALVFLALDGPAVALGASASALGFDPAVTVWLFVLVVRGGSLPRFAWGGLAFLAATGGPIALPLVAGLAIVAVSKRGRPATPLLVAGIVGGAAGVFGASAGFGSGWSGFVLPPFVLFAAGFDERWSGPSTLELAALYGLPMLAIGIAAVVAVTARAYRGHTLSPTTRSLLIWSLISSAWFGASLSAHNPAALAGLTLPLALLSGPVVAEAADAVRRADWRLARYLVPAAMFALAVGSSFVADWARVGNPGDPSEVLLVAGLGVLALSCLGYAAATPVARPALLIPFGAFMVVPLVAGAFAVAFGSIQEPLPSPVSPRQLRDLSAIARESATSQSGVVVVHSSLERDITWAFRNSGAVVVASRVPPTAAVVLWPASLPRPEGYTPLAGEWHLRSEPAVPSHDPLDFVRWWLNRNHLSAQPALVAVYVKATE